MLSLLVLRNLRAFRAVRVPLRPLTVLVGPNNGGKSTILDALLLLRQTLADPTYSVPLVTAGPLVDMGGFDDLIHGGREIKEDSERSFSIELSVPDVVADSWELPSVEIEGMVSSSPTATTLAISFSLDAEGRIRLAEARFLREKRNLLSVGWSDKVKGLVVTGPRLLTELVASPYNFLPDIALPPEPPDESRQAFDFLNALMSSKARTEAWHSLIASLRHITPVRSPIPSMAIIGRSTSTFGEVDGENLVRLLTNPDARTPDGDPIVDVVNYWISERFRMLDGLNPVHHPIDRVVSLTADDRDGFKGINVANMGEGISQLLPVIASVVITRPGQTLLVEQPELHLHPAAQADLGDLFAETVRDIHGPQFVVETHSEYFLLRLRRHVAQGTLKPEQVAVLFVDKPGYESRVKHLELDQQGQFMRWPKGFFEEGYNEALDLASAANE